MAREVTRVVTGKSSIPAPVTKTGTLTTGTVKTYLAYTGSLTLSEVAGADNQLSNADNLYVYENASTHGSVRKIVAFTGNLDSTSWGIEIESEFDADLSAEDFKLVTANLQFFSLTNNGGADGYYDGILLADTSSITIYENSNTRLATRNREAKAIDATGTSFLIIENK